VAAILCCGLEEGNLQSISKWKTHTASALTVRSSSTDLGRGNDIAINGGTFCVGDDCEVHVVKCWNNARSCEMEHVFRIVIYI